MTDTELEQRLTAFLRAESSRVIDTESAWHQLQRRRQAHRRRSRWLAAAGTAAAVIAAGVLPALISPHAGSRPAASHGGSRPASPRPVRTYSRAVVARIPVDGAGAVVAAGGVVWVEAGRPARIVQIDARTNMILRTLTLPALAQPDGAIAAGGGAFWLTTTAGQASGQVLRLDPATGRVVATLRLPVPGRCVGLEFGGGSLWAQCPTGSGRTEFVQIDPATDRVTDQLGPVPGQPAEAAAAPQSLWYQTGSGISGFIRGGRGWRPVTVNDSAYPVAMQPDSLVYGAGAIWAMTEDESIAKIDPATGRIAAILTYRDYDPAYQDALGFLAIGAHSLWLLSYNGAVLRVSSLTARPLGWVSTLGSCGGQTLPEPCATYYAQGSLWVPTASALLRIDPARMPG